MRDLHTAMRNETASLKVMFVSMEIRWRTVRQIRVLLYTSLALGRMYDGGCNVGRALCFRPRHGRKMKIKLMLEGMEQINVAQYIVQGRDLVNMVTNVLVPSKTENMTSWATTSASL